MSTTVQWLGDTEAKPAPGALRRVQALINTIDRESGQDRLANADDARPWLVANGLVATCQAPSTRELQILREVREGLRELTIHNTGGPLPSPEHTAALRDVASEVAVQAAVSPDGTVTLTPIGDSVRARLLGLLLVVQDAQRDGTWTHLKACANDDCLWAFYDRSRNHGGTWCDMASCGNKLKNRDFRARQRANQ
jgi:predicted RNA-binding Zn ribbon-like protein